MDIKKLTESVFKNELDLHERFLDLLKDIVQNIIDGVEDKKMTRSYVFLTIGALLIENQESCKQLILRGYYSSAIILFRNSLENMMVMNKFSQWEDEAFKIKIIEEFESMLLKSKKEILDYYDNLGDLDKRRFQFYLWLHPNESADKKIVSLYLKFFGPSALVSELKEKDKAWMQAMYHDCSLFVHSTFSGTIHKHGEDMKYIRVDAEFDKETAEIHIQTLVMITFNIFYEIGNLRPDMLAFAAKQPVFDEYFKYYESIQKKYKNQIIKLFGSLGYEDKKID